MKLQLLVPQYQETDEMVKPLLDSLAIQQSVSFDEFGVIICNDGSDVFLTEEWLNSYPFKVEYHKEPHRGVSGTRNACFDYATADYVMFCDADDMFVNACGLYVIFLNIEGGFDTLNTAFIEEGRRPDGSVVYITHEKDTTFVHGKVHRRQYLLDNHIRWNEGLTIHEDSYFNIQCLELSNNTRYNDTPYYLWKYRPDSVCRSDREYMLKTYRNLIDSTDALTDEFLKRGRMDKALYYVTASVFDAYYTMNKPDWISQQNVEYRKATEDRFARFFRKRMDLWNAVPIYDKMEISNHIRSRVIKEGMLMENVTVFEWLENIGE